MSRVPNRHDECGNEIKHTWSNQSVYTPGGDPQATSCTRFRRIGEHWRKRICKILKKGHRARLTVFVVDIDEKVEAVRERRQRDE